MHAHISQVSLAWTDVSQLVGWTNAAQNHAGASLPENPKLLFFHIEVF